MRNSLSLTVLLAALLTALLTVSLSADSSIQINYQGRLTGTGGNPVADGSYSIMLTLYDDPSAGTAQWSSGVRQIAVTDGLFHYSLGENVPLSYSLFSRDAQLWLGVTVDGDPEMTPRTLLTSAPSAAVSSSVFGDIKTSRGTLIVDDDQNGGPFDSSFVVLSSVSNLDHHGHVTILKIANNGADSTGLIDLQGDSEYPAITVGDNNPPDSSIIISSYIADRKHHGHVTILKIAGISGDTTSLIDMDGSPQTPSITVGDPNPPDSGIIVLNSVDDSRHHGHVTILKLANGLADTTGLIDLSGDPELPAVNIGDGSPTDSSVVVSSFIDDHKHHGHVTILKLSGISGDTTRLIDMDGSPQTPSITVGDQNPPDSGIIVLNSVDDHRHHGHVTILKLANSLADTTGLIDMDGNPQLPAITVGDGSSPDSGMVVSTSASLADHHGHVTILKIANNGADSTEALDLFGSPDSSKIAMYGGGGGGGVLVIVAGKNPGSSKIGVNNDNPAYEIDVDGTICATNGLCQQSDRRLKTDIKPLSDALSLLKDLHPVRYNWRSDEFPKRNFSHDRQVGFIAQDVQKVLPELVSRGSDGYYALDYARLTPILVSAVQEQEEMLEAQSKDIQDLREEVAKLTALVAKLASDSKEEPGTELGAR